MVIDIEYQKHGKNTEKINGKTKSTYVHNLSQVMFRLLGDDQIKMKHMKDLKKALRIHYAKVKLTKRINNWFITRWGNSLEMKEQAYRGEICTFLRTTGNPCNCYMCSGSNKFVREQKQYVIKKIKSDLED